MQISRSRFLHFLHYLFFPVEVFPHHSCSFSESPKTPGFSRRFPIHSLFYFISFLPFFFSTHLFFSDRQRPTEGDRQPHVQPHPDVHQPAGEDRGRRRSGRRRRRSCPRRLARGGGGGEEQRRERRGGIGQWGERRGGRGGQGHQGKHSAKWVRRKTRNY